MKLTAVTGTLLQTT